jgi:hypothetical protein
MVKTREEIDNENQLFDIFAWNDKDGGKKFEKFASQSDLDLLKQRLFDELSKANLCCSNHLYDLDKDDVCHFAQEQAKPVIEKVFAEVLK